jgi:hypothetical protein
MRAQLLHEILPAAVADGAPLLEIRDIHLAFAGVKAITVCR